jgi:hypothetical protein
MKPLPAPEILGRTPAERMDNALRAVLRVSKETIIKEEAGEKRERAKGKKRKIEQHPNK